MDFASFVIQKTKFQENIKNIILFGSVARGEAEKESDIDIFTAGESNRKEIEKIGQLYGKEIQVKNYPLDTFKNKIKEDILLKEIVKNHIIIKNSEAFVESVMKNG